MEVAKFIASRLAGLLIVLLIASMIVYASLYLTPGGPLSFLIGSRTATPEQVAAIVKEYRLDDPFFIRYFSWLGDVLRGDLGMSLVYREPVSSLVFPRLATTGVLVGYATALIVIAGVSTGLVSTFRGRRAAGTVNVFNVLALSTPAFVVGVLLIILFSVQLGWFPVHGAGDGLLDRLWHLTLPAIAVALASIAYLSRITHAATSKELRSEHVETALGRGIPRRLVVSRHVLRNALMPIVTATGLTAASLIAASVVVENLFALDGVGSLLVRAIMQHDYSVVQAVVLLIVAAFTVINLIVDLAYAWIDPRVSLGGKS